jgi:ATP-dependent DNA helicase RecG
MEINDPITIIKGIGPELAKKYNQLGINTVRDLLWYYPRKYNDYSTVLPISRLKPGKVTIKVEIKQVNGRYVRGGLHITEAVASDTSGSVRLTWFNQPYRASSIFRSEYYVSGQFELRKGRLGIINPSMELASNFPINTARIVPVYKEIKGLTSTAIRKAVKNVIQSSPVIFDTLPHAILSKNKLLNLKTALVAKHFPNSMDDVKAADERLGFEELFELILASMYSRLSIKQEQAIAIPFETRIAKQFVGNLPFTLTNAQKKAIWQIYNDIQISHPMNRLLEGDVGSGKTVVAAMAGVMAMAAGYQVALMAPTELLARQHADTIYNVLEPLGLADKVVLLTGSISKKDRQHAYDRIKEGVAQFMVGTHALIQESVNMHSLALVIIDEQHRFGVEQRKKLLKKAGHTPHMLSLTATPIPRSLALTIFGEMDISILDEKPQNRQEIITKLVNQTDRNRIYDLINIELDSGRQMMVVCPLIEDSSMLAIKSAEATYNELKNGYFTKRRIGLLHGKMKADDKVAVMRAFVHHQLDILVSTTVIEVGVDVPNASIMMIEAPERFGLAQLHQLRGRVGRGTHQSYCFLMQSESSQPSRRLQAIESLSDGFALAELDLELRGAGALYGTYQHGIMDLRIADFTDVKLIARARRAAQEFLENPQNLIQYPHIKKRIFELQSVVHLN